MPVTLHKVALTPAELATLSEEVRRFFILACHIADELATLQKILVGCMQGTSVSEIGTKAYAVQNLVVAKIIAGKLSEAWQALGRYYFSGPSRELESSIPDDGLDALRKIKEYFRGRNLIATVRNEAAFHYGGDGILAELSKVPKDHGLQLFIGEISGNSLYYSAELITTSALLAAMPGEADERAAFDKFVSDVQVIARAFTTFFEGFIYAALMKAKPDLQGEQLVVDAADTAKLDEHAIRFFLEK